MENFKLGDIVARKSYGSDVYFKIVQIQKKSDGTTLYVLKGTNLRIVADAPVEDLEKPGLKRISENDDMFQKRVNSIMKKIVIERNENYGGMRMRSPSKSAKVDSSSFIKAGRVLHIDGDEEYLNVCLKRYKELGVKGDGVMVQEASQPSVLKELLQKYKPDILVLTGHDAMIKGSVNYKSLDSYRNSKYFVKAVEVARDFEPGYDDLVIFAGACQSHYEALIDAGANFASSPHRVLIHALDPVFICEKIAYSSVSKVISPQEIIENTVTGSKGIGGMETRGKSREVSPRSPYA